QDESIAARDRRRKFPHWDHGRKIERCDAGNDSQRLAHRIQVNARSGAFRELTLEQMWDAAGKFDDFKPALDVATRVGNGFSVFGRQKFGKGIELFLNELEKLEHHARPPLGV